MPRILLARPEHQLLRTRQVLAQAGYVDILEFALATIQPLPLPTQLPAAGGLILTSAAALTPDVTQKLNQLPAACVGAATARAAQAAGLTVMHVGTGNGVMLAEELAERFPAYSWLHLKAQSAGTAWYKRLKVVGIPVYRTAYSAELAADFTTAYRDKPPTAVLVFSAGGAAALARVLAAHKLPLPPAVAISAAALKAWPAGGIAAPSPNLTSMLECLP